MGEVRRLFSASRWVCDREGLGGHILMGEGGWGEGGARAAGVA